MRTIYAIGNAHLDIAWVWPWSEGFAAIKATFQSAVQRLEEYDDFVFTSSSAQYYAWLEKSEPELFERIRALVKQGRWVLCGGWWIQPDCNIPCAESLIRQGLYGQRYFLDRFGVTSTVGYNVDSFGHNASLPQILRGSGLDYYVFLRPGPHEKVLPARCFLWESPDGSQVTAYRIPFNYCANLDLPGHLRDCAEQFSHEPEGAAFMMFYGVGNHGGGPTKQNIEFLQSADAKPEGFEVKFGSPVDFFRQISEEDPLLPVYQGELQHNSSGCYSANSQVKQANRKAESALLRAEKFQVLHDGVTGEPAQCDLKETWKAVLMNQFHDILAGCSIPEVYDNALAQIGGSRSQAYEAENHALQRISFHIGIPLAPGTTPLVVFNPHPWPVTAEICHESGSWGNPGLPLENCEVVDSQGRILPCQYIRTIAQLDERRRVVFQAEIPAMGWDTFHMRKSDAAAAAPVPQAGGNVLENDTLRVAFDAQTGRIVSCRDKTDGAELLAGPVEFAVYDDKSDTWGHEALQFSDNRRVFRLESIQRTEDGPVRSSIRVISRFENSRLTETYTLYQKTPWLQLRAKLSWNQTAACCKLEIPLSLSRPRVSYELPIGSIVRDEDALEQPVQSWMDVSGLQGSRNAGMAVINDCKSSASVTGSRIGVMISRSPSYAHHMPFVLSENPDDLSYLDQGMQAFTLRLLPHRQIRAGELTRLALALNQPPVKVPETFHPGPYPQKNSTMSVSADNIIVTALKPAFDGRGYILRANESDGRQTRVTFDIPLLHVKFTASFAPYEIKTWRLDHGSAQPTDLLEFDL